MKRHMFLLTAVLTAILLGGCAHAPVIVSQVSSFHELSPDPSGTTYVVLSYQDAVFALTMLAGATGQEKASIENNRRLALEHLEQLAKGEEGSPEDKAYKTLVKQGLDAKGFKETTFNEAAVIAFVAYGVDAGKDVVSSYPIIGQTGVSSKQTTGVLTPSGVFSSSTTYTPQYGVVGTGVTSQRVFARTLELRLIDRKAFTEGKMKVVYEGKVVSSGSSGQLPVVLPWMIKALFEDFPGKSGTVRKVIDRLP